MPQPLQVSETSLTASAAGCADYAEKMGAVAETPPSGSSCQPSASAIEGLLSDSAAARAEMKKRIGVTTSALRSAAGVYADTDADSAAELGGQVVI